MLSRSGVILFVLAMAIAYPGTTSAFSVVEIDANHKLSPTSSTSLWGTSRREAVLSGIGAAATSAAIALGSNPLPSFAATDLSTFQESPNGIKYLITKEGEGSKPQRAQKVTTQYTLWTGGFGDVDSGTKQVDSSKGFLRGPFPVIVGVGKVIKGWDLMLLDMKVGETRRMVIPSSLGYGERGAGGDIPPNTPLYFEVELESMDPMPNLNDAQKKWLEDNPL